MAVTPFIKPITSRNGVFYAFQSAINDINLVNSQQGYKFSFSKFAMLRIPEMGVSDFADDINKMQFLASGDTPLIDDISSSASVNLANSFQNYCLNMESVLLSQPGYKTQLGSVSERVFFKWLKELGAVRFRDSNTYERNSSVLSETDARFVEEDEDIVSDALVYNKVVKYINDISAVHTNRSDIVYTELYIYVPTDHGSSPHVLFKSVNDDNYSAGKKYVNLANRGDSIEYLSGRDDADTHPFEVLGMTNKSFYDYDGDVDITYSRWSEEQGAYDPDVSWFVSPVPNTYMTDSTFGDASNYRFKKENVSAGRSVEYIRNSLDGIMIDWDIINYKLANTDDYIENFNDFNSYIGSKDFEYNAILIYYDLVDPNDSTKTVTNLYGIQFLNTVVSSGTENIITVSTKYKPDPIDKMNGNAVSHKINFKSDNSHENAGVVKLMNTKTGGDYNTFSMDLFVNALTSMNNMASSYQNNITYITDLRNELSSLRDLYINDVNKTEILLRVGVIEESLKAADSLFENSSSVMLLIQDLFDKYNDILDGETTLDVRYNLEPSVINSVVNHIQEYNVDTVSYRRDITANPVITLNKYTNYIKHVNPIGVDILTVTGDVVVKIDDTGIDWEYGQVLDLVFDGHVKLSSVDVNIGIYTDAKNKSNSGGYYRKTIVELNAGDFESSGGKPMYRIVCIDPVNFVFEVDKIR